MLCNKIKSIIVYSIIACCFHTYSAHTVQLNPKSQKNQNTVKFNYETHNIGDRIIHTITLNPQYFIIKLVKANDNANSNGRETVPSIAKRYNAKIAINGGWFKIDGTPSGTLVIHGKQYALKDQIQPLLIIDSNTISITLSNPKDYLQQNISMLSSLTPILVKNGKIPIEVFKMKEQPYSQHDARTAIGITSNNNIIIIVADYNYRKDLSKITASDIQTLLAKKGTIFAKKYGKKDPNELTLREIKTILKEEYSPQNTKQSLSLLAVAKLMKKIGCKDAINLDGGGSSTLWINGKMVNKTTGNENGRGRSVSDAIILQEKPTLS